MQRNRGEGSISELGPERFWVRLWTDGKRKSLGVHPTREAAEFVLASAVKGRSLKGGVAGSRLDFSSYAERVLDQREQDGIRGIEAERNRFKVHLLDCSLSGKAIEEITSADVAALGRELSRKMSSEKGTKHRLHRRTVTRILSLVSAVFATAVDEGKRASNPCIGVRLKKTQTEATEDVWTWLTGAEQRAVQTCTQIPEWARVMIGFAYTTGLRQGEQWNLELRDLVTEGDDPHVFVRFGSKGEAPKNGKRRKVPLFGDGLAFAKRWLQILELHWKDTNPLKLVFPSTYGHRRQMGGPVEASYDVNVRMKNGRPKQIKTYLLPVWLKAAGIERNVRWHDLRHTCASSLVSGTWGRKWSLHEVMEMLGHSSIKVTERYAHLCDDAKRLAAAETPGTGYGSEYAEAPKFEPAQRPVPHHYEAGNGVPRKSWIYFVQGSQGGLIKIGRSLNPKARIYHMQSSCSDILVTLALKPGGSVEESRLHEKFKHLRAGGEWFRPEPDLTNFILDFAPDARVIGEVTHAPLDFEIVNNINSAPDTT